MSLQDLVLDKSTDEDMSMFIQSQTLEPITINSSTAKFIIPNEGILSRDSYFQFELKAGKINGYLPIGAGIFSLIKRAELRVGSQRIAVQDNMAIFRSITKSYDTPSYRNNYTKFMNGVNTTMVPNPVGSLTTTTGNPNAGFLQPAGAIPNINNFTVQNLPYELELSTDPALTPSWSVKLGDLFPILGDGGLELPCFLIKNPIEILLTFNKQTNGLDTISPNAYGSLACFTSGPNAGATAELVLDKCLLFSDHLYYTDSRMFAIEESMNNSKGMALLYTDLISVVNNQPAFALGTATSTSSQNFVFQVPISNYSVKNIFTCWNCKDYGGLQGTLPTEIGIGSNKLFGKYALMNSVKPYEINVRVNDELHYPQKLISNALKFNESEYVYGSPPCLSAGLYSFNGSNNNTAGYSFQDNDSGFFSNKNDANYSFFNGIHLARNLTGSLHFLGINLSNFYGDSNKDSILINQKPVELDITWYNNADSALEYNNFTFAEVVKMFSLNSGEVVIQDQVNQVQIQ